MSKNIDKGNKSEIKRHAVKGATNMMTISIINIFLQLAITTVLARILMPDEYGVVASVQVVISFAEVFWMLGVGPAIVQKKVLKDKDICTGNTLNILFGISIYFLIFLFSPIIAKVLRIENVSMLYALSLVFVINSISGVSESLLQRELKFKQIAIIKCITTLFNGIFTYVFAIIGFGAWAIVLGTIFSTLLKTIVTLIYRRISFKFWIDKESARELLYFGFGLTLSKIFANLASQGDYMVVSATLGSLALGFYTRAYQLLMIPTNLIGQVVDVVMFPILSKYQENTSRLRYAYLLLIGIIMAITVPLTILFFIGAEKIILVFLGDNWLEIVPAFKILILSLFFRNAYKISDVLFRSVGAVYKRIKYQMLYSILILIGSFIGKRYGINGVAVATSIAITINFIIMLIVSSKLINFTLLDVMKYVYPTLIIGGVEAILSKLSYEFIFNNFNPFIGCVLWGGSMFLIYLVLFITIGMKLLPKDFVAFILDIIKKIPIINKVELFINFN